MLGAVPPLPGAPRSRNEPLPIDRHEGLGSLLHEALRVYGPHEALLELERDRVRSRWRYRDVRREAERLAARLQELGVGPGERVAICMPNGPAWLTSALAVLWRGATLVPLDSRAEPEAQRRLLAHSDARLLVVERAAEAHFADASAEHVFVVGRERGDGCLRPWSEPPEHARFEGPVPRRREDVACIVYSSGTSGEPKGCLLTHGNYLHQYEMLSGLFPIVTGDRYLSILPTHHAIDFMVGFVGPFAGGATVVHQRTLRPEYVRSALRMGRITHLSAVPLLLEAFERSVRERLEALGPGTRAAFEAARRLNAQLTLDRPRPTLSRRLLGPVHEAFGGALRLVVSGGAFVPPERARFLYELGIPVAIGYGLTEATTAVTVNDLRPFRAETVGRPLPGVEVEIRDPDPDSGVGEVWVRGPTVFAGYLDAPEATAEVLVDGWLRTGDLGRLDASGHLRLYGRRKDMIVTPGGKNVYPSEIEAAFEGLPCEELVVLAEGYVWPGTPLGRERLLAVVRGARGAWRDELRARNRRLPAFKRLGGVLRWEAPFPRTTSLKVRRGELADAIRAALRPDAVEPLEGA